MTGFIITKFHELIRFFIKNSTRMSLKLEKPEKIRISFKCYLSSNKNFFLESPRHANGYQYAKIYIFHAFHDHFTFSIKWKGTSYFIRSHGFLLIPPYYSVFPQCHDSTCQNEPPIFLFGISVMMRFGAGCCRGHPYKACKAKL